MALRTVLLLAILALAAQADGAAACGDNPSQNFTSCAELEGLMEKEK